MTTYICTVHHQEFDFADFLYIYEQRSSYKKNGELETWPESTMWHCIQEFVVLSLHTARYVLLLCDSVTTAWYFRPLISHYLLAQPQRMCSSVPKLCTQVCKSLQITNPQILRLISLSQILEFLRCASQQIAKPQFLINPWSANTVRKSQIYKFSP